MNMRWGNTTRFGMPAWSNPERAVHPMTKAMGTPMASRTTNDDAEDDDGHGATPFTPGVRTGRCLPATALPPA